MQDTSCNRKDTSCNRKGASCIMQQAGNMHAAGHNMQHDNIYYANHHTNIICPHAPLFGMDYFYLMHCMTTCTHVHMHWICKFWIHLSITWVDKTTLEPINLDRPKSAILIFFPSLLTRMFCGLRSRWTMLLTCIQSTPCRICSRKSCTHRWRSIRTSIIMQKHRHT